MLDTCKSNQPTLEEDPCLAPSTIPGSWWKLAAFGAGPVPTSQAKQAEDKNSDTTSVTSGDVEQGFKKQPEVDGDEDEKEWVSLHEDVYNLFFLSNIGGPGFYYSLYVFVLKLALYAVLAMDTIDTPRPEHISKQVLIAQFLILPVAVAMQDDLTTTFFLFGNVKFSPTLKDKNPDATRFKFHCANVCRGIDGVCSLFVNFVIMMKATAVLPLFLNFAALQFLQNIDNIALDLCAEGFLTDRLEEVAGNVKTAELPRKRNRLAQVSDTVLFASTYLILLIFWMLCNCL